MRLRGDTGKQGLDAHQVHEISPQAPPASIVATYQIRHSLNC